MHYGRRTKLLWDRSDNNMPWRRLDSDRRSGMLSVQLMGCCPKTCGRGVDLRENANEAGFYKQVRRSFAWVTAKIVQTVKSIV